MDEAFARKTYGWDDTATMEPGPRGAVGQIWHVRTPQGAYALKEILTGPPSEAVIAAEQQFAVAVRIPRSHRDSEGRFVTPTPQGTWLRLFDWLDLSPPQATPEEIGTLFARLHKTAPKASTEIDGGTPDPWYDTLRADTDLAEFVTPADPADMVLCHRDVHPDNVYRDPRGLVVVDWDQLGPAQPSRELARALFDWYSDPAPDLGAMRSMLSAYHHGGGPGRITQEQDFSMLIAARVNFLKLQRETGGEWAEREIEEAERIMPTPGQLTEVLAMARATPAGPGAAS